MVTIDKIKINKKGESLSYAYRRVETDGRRSAVKEETGEYSCHPDLINAFDRLAPHIAVLAGYVSAKTVKFNDDDEVKNPQDFESYKCTSVSLGGGETEGFVLTGHKLRWDGKAVGFNTPFDPFAIDEESAKKPDAKPRYPYMEELQIALNDLDTEARHYMNGTKKGEPVEKKSKKKEVANPNQLTIEQAILNEVVTTLQIAESAIPGQDGVEMFKDKPAHVKLAEAMNGGDINIGDAPALAENEETDDVEEIRSKKQHGHIPQADPAAMQRIKEADEQDKAEARKKPVTSPADVAGDIVKETNDAINKRSKADGDKSSAPGARRVP